MYVAETPDLESLRFTDVILSNAVDQLAGWRNCIRVSRFTYVRIRRCLKYFMTYQLITLQ